MSNGHNLTVNIMKHFHILIHLANAELPNAELLNAELLNAELLNAELPNIELLNVELPMSNYRTPKITQRRILQNIE